METDTTSERVTEQEPALPEPQRSAWELIDEEWGEKGEAPMCM
ncbi:MULTISPECIES: hypothetical protein [Stutzerimonas]|nr:MULTISPECIES: hypothetical protein [Stutzerimonas]MDH1587996.1 hypothetical protein [Stutzerimonas stutzeri]MDL2174702.1 hypothetical protein [Stutzerimonas sp. FeSN7]